MSVAYVYCIINMMYTFLFYIIVVNSSVGLIQSKIQVIVNATKPKTSFFFQ